MFAMSSVLAAVISVWIVSSLYRRQQRKPAAALHDGSGHLLLHAGWERAIAFVVLAAALLFAALTVYVMVRPGAVRSLPRTLPVLLGSAAIFSGLAAWCFRSLRRRIRVNDAGVTLYQGKSAIDIAWASVTRVTTDLTGALLICGSNGAQIAVNKLLVGIPTLVSYMRRHLPERMYSNVFVTYTPQAHLGP
jgi:hypothetical protein